MGISMSKTKKNPVEKATKHLPKPQAKEVGKTGLDYLLGNNMEEFLRELQSNVGVKTYKEMSSNDPTVGAVLFAIRQLIKQVEWDAKPASNNNEDIQAADFIRSNMHNMTIPWKQTINEILSKLVYGWSFHEVVYGLRGGNVVWQKLPIRAQDSLYEWKFDENNDLEFFVQQPKPTFQRIEIPMEKGLLFRNNVYKNNPEGTSILRNAYLPWFFIKKIQVLEGIGIERDFAGIPLIRIPGKYMRDDAPPEERQVYTTYKSMLENMRLNKQAGLVLPTDRDRDGNFIYEASLISSPGQKQFDTTAIVNRYKLDIVTSVLADFLLLGQKAVGSYSLASTKTKLFAMAVGSIMDDIAEVFNRHAVPQLFAFNGAPERQLKSLPKMWHGDIEDVDLDVLGNYIAKLAMTGVMFDENDENFLRSKAGLPFRSND
jgi:hypothetical protein